MSKAARQKELQYPQDAQQCSHFIHALLHNIPHK